MIKANDIIKKCAKKISVIETLKKLCAFKNTISSYSLWISSLIYRQTTLDISIIFFTNIYIY